MRKMMKLQRVGIAAAAALLSGFTAIAAAADSKPPMSQQELAAQQAAEQQQQQLSAIAANRGGVISALLGQWQGAASRLGYGSGWAAEFQSALQSAAVGQLLALQSAANYDAVRAILQGRPTAVNLQGAIDIKALGDLVEDLTYTPVNPPCRIFDTRLYSGGVPPAAGATRNYFVHGVGSLAAQGGNSAGCPAPKGEPVGVSANITAISTGVAGHLRVFPYLATLPTVSFVNFGAAVGNNIANAGILTTCYTCGPDLSVYQGATSHSVGDVMGYFYPAVAVTPGLSQTGATTTIGVSCTNYAGGNVTITVPRAGKIAVTSQVWLISSGFGTLYIGNSPTDCPFANFAEGYQAQPYRVTADNPDASIGLSRTVNVTGPGTYTYFLNAIGSGGTLFWFAAMQANFTPQ